MIVTVFPHSSACDRMTRSGTSAFRVDYSQNWQKVCAEAAGVIITSGALDLRTHGLGNGRQVAPEGPEFTLEVEKYFLFDGNTMYKVGGTTFIDVRFSTTR